MCTMAHAETLGAVGAAVGVPAALAALASFFPARRAASIEPTVALRSDQSLEGVSANSTH